MMADIAYNDAVATYYDVQNGDYVSAAEHGADTLVDGTIVVYISGKAANGIAEQLQAPKAGYIRVYRAVSPAEHQDILGTGKFRQGPNSLEGKWFAGSLDGAKAHGNGLYPKGRYLLIEVDIPKNAKSLSFRENLDGHGPAFYLHNEDLPPLRPRSVE